MLTHGSLFSGIGGFDLGFERAGIKTIWQVEIDEYCLRVLAKHFPDVRRFSDIRDFGTRFMLECPDIISGGFPCQDISNAGKRAGIDGERSGLWSEYARIIRELRPRYVVVENVAALLGRGMERVLGDLAACGYDAEWQSIRASDVGAPHRRERIWIVAYPGCEHVNLQQRVQRIFQPQGGGANVADSKCAEWWPPTERRDESHGYDARWEEASSGIGVCRQDVADAGESRLPQPEQETIFGAGRRQEGRAIAKCDWWAVEPDVGRVAHGIPARVDRLRGLGNAIVPQIAEWIGRRIVESTEAAGFATGRPRNTPRSTNR